MMVRPEEQRPRWTTEEDQWRLESQSRNPDLHGPDIATLAGLSRSGKRCRERWNNHLDPDVKREDFSQEEDDAIICFQFLYGNCSWASIAAHLPGRTHNDVRSRWYNHLKKNLGTSTDESIPDPQSSSGDQPHATQLFHLNDDIDPNASSSSIPTLVSTSQEIANPWSPCELANPKFPEGYFPSDDEFESWISEPFSDSLRRSSCQPKKPKK